MNKTRVAKNIFGSDLELTTEMGRPRQRLVEDVRNDL
jgi:hypothetical protein